MKAFSGLLTYLSVLALLSATAFVAIAITTGQSVRFWEEPTAVPTAIPTIAPTATTEPTATVFVDNSVEINFIFCAKPSDGSELTAENCSPLSIREDSKVRVQLAIGESITIDGFKEVKTGFKVKIDKGDTVMAVSIENPYFATVTFGEATLKLERVSEPTTVYLPLAT